MPTDPATDSQPQRPVDASISRRREILRRLGQGTVVAAAAAVPVAASAGVMSRWGMDPSRRNGNAGSFKLGVSS